MINQLRRALAVSMAAVLVALVIGAPAATAAPRATKRPGGDVVPMEQYGSCGNHFLLSRYGPYVRVVGTRMNELVSWAGLAWISSGSTSYGRYIAYADGGMNIQLNTRSSTPRDFRIALTDYDNTYTICASVYHV